MLGNIALAIAGLAVIGLGAVIAQRTTLPAPVFLVAVGTVYAFLPGPNLQPQPRILLDLVIPPLLYAAAYDASLFEIRAHLRSVLSLSVALVLVTALAVGAVVSAVVPAIPLAAACALGAAVAPTDPVAALAIARRTGLPARLITLIEGEGLLNDATALTLYTVALAAVSGHFSIALAFGDFFVAAIGGIAIGFAVGKAIQWIGSRPGIDPVVVAALSLAVPFLAYLPAEALHTSGVLAVVVCGLLLGHHGPAVVSGRARLQIRATWSVVDFLLQGLVFLVIGQELPAVLRGLDAFGWSTILWATLCTVGVVIVTRPLWLSMIGRVPFRRPWPGGAGLPLLSSPIDGTANDSDAARRLNWRETTVLSWAGTRGVITLAAAFAIPTMVNGAPFPGRPLIVFCAYIAVIFTLLAEGLTFAPIVKRTGLRVSAEGELETLARARAAAVDAGTRRLDQLEADHSVPADLAEWLRTTAELRRRQGLDQLQAVRAEDDAEPAAESESDTRARVRVEMIAAEREELIAWRDSGRLPDKDFRAIQRQLDREEGVLPPQ